MSEAPLAPTEPPAAEPARGDRSWLFWTSLFVGGFVIFGLILGLIIFPSRGEGSFDPFTAICRSLGIPGYEKIPLDPGAATASAPVSNVAWTVETNRLLSHASATKGAALAKDTCGACHGEDGKSTDLTQFPNLAGQSQAAIFKELRDFQSGDRASDTMGPIAQSLTQEQMADVAAFYAAQKPDDLRAADSAVCSRSIHWRAKAIQGAEFPPAIPVTGQAAADRKARRCSWGNRRPTSNSSSGILAPWRAITIFSSACARLRIN